jgi:photosystem II stability/assembly factor-like uncharacterized protein
MQRGSLLRRCGLLAVTGAVFALLLSTASAGVNAPQSGWYSGNPLLGPNTIEDVVCSDPTCYATGTFGTVLKTTNAGSSWAGVVTGVTADLPRARLGGGGFEQLVTGGNCTILYSHDVAGHFTRLPFTASDTTCSARAAAFSFPAFDIGYIVDPSGGVLTTSDEGQTFTRRTAIPAAPVTDVLCVSETTCFATAGGTIQRTTDRAGSWTQVSGGNQQLNGVVRADATTYYAVGAGSTVLKSVDGGASWASLSVVGTPPGELTKIRCSGAQTCLVATRDGNQILRTIDGGLTFSSIVPSTDPTYAVELASPTRAIAAGASGSVEISDDAGATWQPVGSRIAGSFLTLAPASGAVAYAGGANGVLARTADGGESWQSVGAPTSAAIVSIAAPSPSTAYVLAADGTLQRSDNGGESYRLLSGSDPSMLGVAATDAGHVLLVGAHGISRSTDGGATFARVEDADAHGPLLRAHVRGSTVIAYSRRRLVVSTDAGATWRRIPLHKGMFLADVSFVSPKAGYVVSRFGLWRTSNAGRSWQRVGSLGSPAAYGVDFSDARHGYVIVNRFGSFVAGFVLRTSDGGATWRPQLVSPTVIRDVASAGGTDYALAGDDVLYATKTGGDAGAAQMLSLSIKHRVLRRPGLVTVDGRLKPADGGEHVSVAMHDRRGWSVQIVLVASNGSFTTHWRVKGTSDFVAQVLGDAGHSGAATKLVRVGVRR